MALDAYRKGNDEEVPEEDMERWLQLYGCFFGIQSDAIPALL